MNLLWIFTRAADTMWDCYICLFDYAPSIREKGSFELLQSLSSQLHRERESARERNESSQDERAFAIIVLHGMQKIYNYISDLSFRPHAKQKIATIYNTSLSVWKLENC